MAWLPSLLPDGLNLPIGVSIYADDIAICHLVPRGLRRQRPHVIRKVQNATNTTASFLRSVRLSLSPTKTEAMLLHTRPGARSALLS